MIRRVFRAVFRWLDDLRFAWQRRLCAYILVVAAFGLCLVLIQRNYRDDAARALAQSTQDCTQRAQGRQVLRDLVTASYSPSTTDYSRVPSYADLDPATKRFLADLGAGGNRLAERRDEVLARIPPIVCPVP